MSRSEVSRRFPGRLATGLALTLGLGTGIVALSAPAPAEAAVSPLLPRPAEVVTADALPTAQINGVAWDQEVVGDVVYVGGNFSHARPAGASPGTNQRSEEHTSELQSRGHLVCRLLLEQKKNITQ